jgi:hypothetical protein
MATKFDFEGKEVYVADTKAEWKELIKEGHVTYQKEETRFGQLIPRLAKLGPLIYAIKSADPEAVIIGALDKNVKDQNQG